MEKKLFLDRLPEEYKSKLLNPNVGVNGNVYKVEGQELVFKDFGDMTQFEDDFYRLSMYKDVSFVFPKTLVYVQNRLIGYLMEFVNGINLSKLSQETRLEDFIKAMEILELSIKDLSFQGMELVDLNQNNIMYTKDKTLKVVDTDLYQFPYLYEEEILRMNFKEYNGFMIPVFLTEKDLQYFSKELLEYYKYATIGGRMPARKLLIELKKYLENISGKEHQTIKDVKETLALIRKK